MPKGFIITEWLYSEINLAKFCFIQFRGSRSDIVIFFFIGDHVNNIIIEIIHRCFVLRVFDRTLDHFRRDRKQVDQSTLAI